MTENILYKKYSKFLQEKYGEKVYKLPINLPLTCPNRDGTLGTGGCTFCGEEGGSFESLSNVLSVKEQITKNRDYIKKKYKANKYIAYFQNFTNTYQSLEKFKQYVKEALMEDVVAIYISTRPDCIQDEYLEFLSEVEKKLGIDIVIELGLQTVNYHSLLKINRGHTLAEFIDASIRIKKYNIGICTHIILNLPWDNMDDAIESAKILSSLGIDQVKLHSLYLIDGTKMGEEYKKGEIDIISKEEYIDRVIAFLEHLNPEIVIQRLIGRAPEENSLFVNWNESWWKIRDEIEEQMVDNGFYQGRRFNYLNGKALNNIK